MTAAKQSAKSSGPRSQSKGTQRFRKGASGNPKGRPKGSRNKKTLLAENLLEGEAEELVRKCIEMAKEGDRAAMRLVMERLYPPPRSRPLHFDLPKTETAEELLAAFDAVLAAVATGEITPDEAQVVAALLSQKVKLIETVDLDRKLTELEIRSGIARD